MGKRKRAKKETTEQSQGDKHFLMIMTAEPYQLARIHHAVFKRSGIAKIFSRLKCMDYDPDQKRWVWLHDGEAKQLQFNWRYASIPAEKHPIVLGSFFSWSEDEMFLNVNSFDRATKAIAFFDGYFRKRADPEGLGQSNGHRGGQQILPSAGGGFPRHEDYFDKQPVTKTDPEAFMKKLESMVSSAKDKEERTRLALSYLEDSAKQPYPEIERLPTNFYEDGIEGLEASLRMRQAIAYQHWLGNTGYTYYDLIQDTLHHPPEVTRR